MRDEFATANAEILATQANIESYTHVCLLLAPGDGERQKFVSDAITRMRKAVPGGVRRDGRRRRRYELYPRGTAGTASARASGDSYRWRL